MDTASPDVGSHYGEVTEKLMASHKKWALMIHVITVASVWPSWRSILWVVGTTLAIIPLNHWITLWLMPRRGPIVAEVVRTAGNLSIGVLLYTMIGWPLPVWLWLPYIALAYASTRRLTIITLTASWLVMTVAGLRAGVPLLVPLMFGGIAYLCQACMDKRISVIHGMFARSEEQRRELDAAHESLRAAVEARERIELELRQSQKLEAIGRLASGVAHEINTPLQYLASSVTLVEEGVSDLTRLIAQWRTQLWAPGSHVDPAVLERLDGAARACDLEALEPMLADSLAMAHDGVHRVSTIVRSMKELAHPDRSQRAPTDLNRTIQAMLAVARHEYRYVAELTTELSEIPPVECHAGEISQVLLNLVVNAAQAVGDVVKGSGRRGCIKVATRIEGDAVVVSVSDSGGGIPDAISDKIFEPFFTTKVVGQGTGQGLALARATVEKHGGSLSFTSASGNGTTFSLRLPIATSRSLCVGTAA